MGQFDQSISMLEEAILLGNEERYIRSALIFNKYYNKIFDANNVIDELNKLLIKSDNYRDSVNTYDNLRSLYINLGQVNRSYEYVEKVRDMNLKKFGKLSSIKYLLNKRQIGIFQHLDMMDSVKSFIDYYDHIVI